MQTLTVADRKSFKKIPNVPGLLSYRADKKQLYVNNGSKWQPLNNEEEVIKITVVFSVLCKVVINMTMLSINFIFRGSTITTGS